MRIEVFVIVCVILLLRLPALHGKQPERTIEVRSTSAADDNLEDDGDPINWTAAKAVQKAKENMNTMIKNSLPMMMRASGGLSPDCTKSLMQFAVGVKQLKDWAIKMLDSSSKLPPGILVGTTIGLGSYDECVDIVATDERDPPEERFRGQYCLVDLWAPKDLLRPMDEVAKASGLKNFNTTFLKVFPENSGFGKRFKLSLSFCLPSTCSVNDVDRLTRAIIHQSGFGSSVFSCEVKTPPEVNRNQIAVICILVPLACLILLGTLVDVLFTPSPVSCKMDSEKSFTNFVVQTLKVFSLYSNTKRFLEPAKHDGKLDMLSGVRFFSTTWIILGHSYYFPDDLHFAKLKDMFTVVEVQYDIPFMVVINTALAVDTFFLVTGFLTTYSSWRRMNRQKGKLAASTFFLKRIVRLLPAQFLAIGLLMILPLFGNGPIWKTTWKIPVENCENYWWANILSIQNFWGLEDMCLFHTWFIAVSMQMHLITFFLLILFYKRPRLGILANIGLIVGGGIAVAMVTFYKGLPPTFDVDVRTFPVFHEFYNTVYSQLYSHFGPYCTGVLLGYFVCTHPGKRIRQQGLRAVCWLLAVVAALATVYGLYAFTDNIWTRQHPFSHVTYSGTFRTAWGLCVAWLLFDCISYPKGIVNSILSWSPLVYLDRLTFFAYLLHPLVMYYHQARVREVINSDYFDMVYYFIGNAVLTYIVSFVFHIAVEQPVNYLDSVLFGKSTQNRQQPDVESKGNIDANQTLSPKVSVHEAK